MYEDYFHFKASPFQLTPDYRFYFDSSEHQKAMAHLTFGLSQPEGFVIITGEVGAGKTTMVNYLISQLNEDDYIIVKIVSTQIEANDLLKLIALNLGLSTTGLDKAEILKMLEQFMHQSHHQRRKILLVIDEVQNLSFSSLEELRMLSNFQIGAQAPMQCLLIGQPQFKKQIAHEDLEQLRQRIIASYHIMPMSKDETQHYIEYRLIKVGWQNFPYIADEAFEKIYEFTKGLPRKINTLCSRLLLMCFLEEQKAISGDMVDQVAEELKKEVGPNSNIDLSRPEQEKKKTPRKKTVRKRKRSGVATNLELLQGKIDALEGILTQLSQLVNTRVKPETD